MTIFTIWYYNVYISSSQKQLTVFCILYLIYSLQLSIY
uniref:Uncharacterized protein n=1 Tax=Polysiphonia urceolata TaxID=173545 RepID=A0A1Z1MCC1_POLUR|nr:hypothetical protein [Polysiphonia stricta]ARW63626.1 hypothetical protein [Polysiphonia stricta]